MIRKPLVVMLFIFLLGTTANALEVANISLPDTLKADKTTLNIMGAGLRTVFGFKVYAGGLYLENKLPSDKDVINADKPMAIRLQWRRSAPPEKINEVYYKSFAQAVGAPEAKVYGPDVDYGPLTDQINTFMSWIAKDKVEKGNYWNNIYIPGVGTKVYMFDGKKETHMGTIKGLEFKKAFFSIWLGDEKTRSVNEKLKSQMLGKVAADTLDDVKDEKEDVKDVSLDELDNI